MTLAKQTPEQYTVHLPSLEQRKQSLLDDMRAFLIEKYVAKLEGFPVTVNPDSVDPETRTVAVRLAPEGDRLNLYTPSVRVAIDSLTDKQVLAAEPSVSEVVA